MYCFSCVFLTFSLSSMGFPVLPLVVVHFLELFMTFIGFLESNFAVALLLLARFRFPMFCNGLWKAPFPQFAHFPYGFLILPSIMFHSFSRPIPFFKRSFIFCFLFCVFPSAFRKPKGNPAVFTPFSSVSSLFPVSFISRHVP